MSIDKPRKRRSALAALPPPIALEILAITVNVGGAVTAMAAFLLFFAACHQVRLARWRRHAAT